MHGHYLISIGGQGRGRDRQRLPAGHSRATHDPKYICSQHGARRASSAPSALVNVSAPPPQKKRVSLGPVTATCCEICARRPAPVALDFLSFLRRVLALTLLGFNGGAMGRPQLSGYPCSRALERQLDRSPVRRGCSVQRALQYFSVSRLSKTLAP